MDYKKEVRKLKMRMGVSTLTEGLMYSAAGLGGVGVLGSMLDSSPNTGYAFFSLSVCLIAGRIMNSVRSKLNSEYQAVLNRVPESMLEKMINN